jgi:hypothetical protein
MIGEGKNIWPNVHISDGEQAPLSYRKEIVDRDASVADLYICVFDAKNSNRNPGHGREGYYFGENGEHRLFEVAKEIGSVFVELGHSTHAKPVSFTQKEIDKYFGVRLRRVADFRTFALTATPDRDQRLWGLIQGAEAIDRGPLAGAPKELPKTFLPALCRK